MKLLVGMKKQTQPGSKRIIDYTIHGMTQENVSINWQDFENNMKNKLKQYIHKKDFSPITLVNKGNRQVPAHKVILSSGSTLFRGLLAGSPGHPQHLLYLRGVEADVLEAILEFIYTGEAVVSKEKIQEFLDTAADMGVEGLDKVSGKVEGIQSLEKCSVEYFPSGSVNEVENEKNLGTLLTDEDILF